VQHINADAMTRPPLAVMRLVRAIGNNTDNSDSDYEPERDEDDNDPPDLDSASKDGDMDKSDKEEAWDDNASHKLEPVGTSDTDSPPPTLEGKDPYLRHYDFQKIPSNSKKPNNETPPSARYTEPRRMPNTFQKDPIVREY
jgi:hypothetical protein